MPRSAWTMAVALVVGMSLLAAPSVAVGSPHFVTSITGRVKLGTASATDYAQVITEAPDDDVYFAEGAHVYRVVGNAAPGGSFLTAPGSVLALDATPSDLYVETRTHVLEYALPGRGLIGAWSMPATLSSPPANQAGMSIEGDDLWTWTDWSTDESGYEYGSVVQFNTSTWASKVFDKGEVDPDDTAANALGYFFLANDRVVRVEPNGVKVTSARNNDAIEAPIAVIGGHLYLAASREPSGKDYLDTFSATTLALTHWAALGTDTFGIVRTTYGLAGVFDGSAIGLIDATSGAETDRLAISHVTVILTGGSTLSAISQVASAMYLDRLG
jgi:hypothetical protein